MKAKIFFTGFLAILASAMLVAAKPAKAQTSFEKIVDSARGEGKLHVWYSTPSKAKTWNALKEAFERRFNLKVDLTRTYVYSTNQPPRLAAEGKAGVLNADVVQISLSQPYLDLQKEIGLFAVTDWVGQFGKVWPGIREVMEFEPKSIRGYGLRLQDFIRVIAYNTNMVTKQEVPDTMEGFTDPKWKGKIIFGSPSMDPLSRLSAHPDWTLEKALEVGKALLANKPLFARGSVAATDMVARGEGAVFLFSSWASYAKRKAEGAPLAFKSFRDFVIFFGNAYAPLKAARYPNIAKLFVAWYAMEGAQITEKMEYRASVIQPGTEKKKLFDKIKKGRVVVTETSIEDVRKRAKFNKALRKLVLR